jgi:hypothetical protein
MLGGATRRADALPIPLAPCPRILNVAQRTVYFTITWMSDYSTIFLMFLIKKASKSLEIYATDSKRLEFSGLPLLVLPRYQITASTR